MKYSIIDIVKSEYEVNKSRFITLLFKVENQDDAVRLIKEAHKEYPDATHVVYAYILDNTAHSNDDSEPKGSAGVPTLEVLEKANLTDVIAITIRYFGGIKLGAGGVLRAYTKSVSLALQKANIVEETSVISFAFTSSYLMSKTLTSHLSKAIKLQNNYTDKVEYIVEMKENDFLVFEQYLKTIKEKIELYDIKKSVRFL